MPENQSNCPTPQASVSSELLGERRSMAHSLRKQGLTYREIGLRLGVGPQRARQLYRSAEWRLTRPPHWSDGLSIRAANCLNNINVQSRQQAMDAMNSGQLVPLKRPRNYGWKTHKEVAVWLGLPEPMKPTPAVRVRQQRTCPHCGGQLS